MITHKCKQGSPEWAALWIGIATSSKFGCIVGSQGKRKEGRPKGTPSDTTASYKDELIAERFTGQELENFQRVTKWMERGSKLEDEAVKWYAMEKDGEDGEVERIGFVITDSRWLGTSTDGLVGIDGVLEIKCPKANLHVKAMRVGIGPAYVAQCQGALMITGRKWVDTLSYNPLMPPALFRIERDEEYITNLADSVLGFCAELDALALDLGVPENWRDNIIVQPASLSLEQLNANRVEHMTDEEREDWDRLVKLQVERDVRGTITHTVDLTGWSSCKSNVTSVER